MLAQNLLASDTVSIKSKKNTAARISITDSNCRDPDFRNEYDYRNTKMFTFHEGRGHLIEYFSEGVYNLFNQA